MPPERWDEEADVVVLGFGLAGAVAAIEAFDSDPGAVIVVLEKAPEERAGGNSRVSGQRVLCAGDLEQLLVYQRALNEPNPIPDDVLRAWGEGMMEVEPWVARMAAEVGFECVRCPNDPEFPALPGSSSVSHSITVHPPPAGVWRTFKEHVERRAIDVLYETRAVELVQEAASRLVLGVVAERRGERIAVRAHRGVIVATGGYENEPTMQRDYGGHDRIYTLGTPANTGDGVKLLQKAGADLWHMRNRTQTGGLWPAMKFPEYDAAFTRSASIDAGSWLEVARDDARFHDEAGDYHCTHAKRRVNGTWLDLPHASLLPVHMIFDEAVRRASCLASHGPKPPSAPEDFMGWNLMVDGYRWSEDNAAEIERGWIARAGSIRELAALLGRDPAALEATVERFNAACAAGLDADFGRDPARMRPISIPPFYAVELVPGVTFTTGGGRRSARSQVLDLDGQPIPRLYEAGQLGSTFANLFQSGASLAECIVFGRIAGKEAVRRSDRAAARLTTVVDQGEARVT